MVRAAQNVEFQLPAVYPITNSEISGLTLSEQVRRLADGGATLVQIRDKHSTSRAFYEAAVEGLKIAREHHVLVLINDRVDIAILCGADGVHLGQEDISPEHARRLLGDKAVIGFSTHTIAQVEAAIKLPVNYIAFGPIFTTSTKENADRAVGLDLLAEVISIAGEMPVVAIGGIDKTNIGSVMQTGADSAAMIGSLFKERQSIADNYMYLSKLARAVKQQC
jgi:thiamine-phosphate pyrophosphorylase